MVIIPNEAREKYRDINIIAIGVSTGGPTVLETIFSNLGDDFPPIVVVQHISPGFLSTMVDWLKTSTGKKIFIGKEGEMLDRGCIYFAPDGVHIEVNRKKAIQFNHGEVENGTRPSISHLFRSVKEAFAEKVMAILLTGMGRDGVDEMKLLKEKGAMTIVQDKESSVVHGMAGDAIAQGASQFVLNPKQISELICNINKRKYYG